MHAIACVVVSRRIALVARETRRAASRRSSRIREKNVVARRVSVVRRRKVGSSASRSRLDPGFDAPIRRRRRPTTRVADTFAVSHRAIEASTAPPEAVPRGNRKHGFFSRSRRVARKRVSDETRRRNDRVETQPSFFHREKTVARKGNERRAPWSGRRGTPPLPSAARSRGASVATPSSR